MKYTRLPSLYIEKRHRVQIKYSRRKKLKKERMNVRAAPLAEKRRELNNSFFSSLLFSSMLTLNIIFSLSSLGEFKFVLCCASVSMDT
jgi:hypothetical protein